MFYSYNKYKLKQNNFLSKTNFRKKNTVNFQRKIYQSEFLSFQTEHSSA